MYFVSNNSNHSW